MANFQVISTNLIQASTGIHQKNIYLNSNDVRYLLVGSIQKGLLFPKPNSSESKVFDETLLHHLQASLSRTLDFFFPLAGRLSTHHDDDKTIFFFIDCNNVGAQFVHAVAENVTISDILEPTYFPLILPSFFPMNGIKNNDVTKPLVAVQVTELADGVFIGFTMNHAVADGTTFWNFINSWSEISRGSDKISKVPVFDNWYRDCPTSFPASIIETDDGFTPPPLQERVFHFSKQKIVELKARANTETENENSKISSLQSLLAHVWRSLINCRQIDPEGETNFRFIMGLRSRLEPAIQEGYFGNAIQDSMLTMKARELLENGIGHAAVEMNKTIATHTDDKVTKILEGWTKNPDVIRLGGYTRNALIMVSSPRFNVYGNDFGWGKPIAVRSGPANKFDGMITVYQGIQEGSIDIEVCTSPQALQAMGNDSHFMDAVSMLKLSHML